LDEPTNDLDRDARLLFQQFLQSRRGGELLISHDRECLALCQRVLELSTHGLTRFGGGWDEYQLESRRERERLQTSLDRAKRTREVARETAREQQARQAKRNQRGAREAARGGMPKILLGRRKSQAQSTTGRRSAAELERVDDAVRIARQAFEAQKIDPVMYADLPSERLPAQKLVAEARGLNIRFAHWLFPQDLSFSWRGSTRVAVRGANGRGKSTLLKLILGQLFATKGELRVGALRALYLDQRLSALDEAQTVWDCVRAACALSDRELRNGLSRFLFAKDSVFRPVGELSGGERLRAALARRFLSAQKPELLVLDEPTNNLDLPNIEFLDGLVPQFRGALVVVSHHEEFLDRCGLTETLSL
jgi:ATPase subunit of ABC transporter with duplicated ATPase domains